MKCRYVFVCFDAYMCVCVCVCVCACACMHVFMFCPLKGLGAVTTVWAVMSTTIDQNIISSK